MSYILDALRRADAERQRGAVPGLHAQPMAGVLSEAAAAPGAPARRLGWLAAALALVGLAVAGAWLLRPAAAPGVPVAAPSLPAVPPGPVAATAQGLPLPASLPTLAAASPLPAPGAAPGARPPAPTSLLPAVQPAVQPAAPGLAILAPAPRLAQPLPAAVPVQPVPSAGRPVLAASPAAAAAELAPPPAPTQPAIAAAPARLPSLAELPEAQRRELGPLVVGGAMHAEQATMRIVILNGQVFHEGDKLGPDLQVQQIRLKSVVLSHRGQRFELPF